jgi:hypothetical protein
MLLASIGGPKWHSESPDALIDSMIWGGINAIEPPYVIRVSGAAMLPKDVHDHVELVKGALAKARADHQRLRGRDVEVVIEIEP